MYLNKSLITIFFIGLSQFLIAQEKINVFEGNKYIIKDNIKVTVKKEIQDFMFTSFNVAISQPFMEIIDIDGKKIDELNGITYSYINALADIGAAAVISFDMSQEASKKYEIRKLKFLSPDNGNFIYYLHKLTSGKQKSKKKDALDAYSFGALRTAALSKTIATYYKNKNWYYIIAQIKVKNKETGKQNNYKIRLNPKVYNDFEAEIRLIYKDVKAIKNFPRPVVNE